MRSWLEIEVAVPAPLADPLSDLLFDLGTLGLELDDDDVWWRVRAYFPAQEPQPLVAAIDAFLSRNSRARRDPVRWRILAEDSWVDSWKEWCVPVPVGETLWIRPPWATQVPPGRIEVVIEPGMAFGTGHHPSTVGCLVLLEEVVGRDHVDRALDLGTGSGILAIALAKLGVRKIDAVDIDAVACDVARSNIRQNGVGDAVEVGATWSPASGHYDLVVANLYRNALDELASRIAVSLAPAGHLVCAGFYAEDVPAVTRAYQRCGLSLNRQWEWDRWAAQWFRKPSR